MLLRSLSIMERVILPEPSRILELYNALERYYGDLKWWPAETPDEILIGAILTQNTSWKNVERSIYRLREVNLITIDSISESSPELVAEKIRSSGFYNQKAKRLVDVCRTIRSFGGLSSLSELDDDRLEHLLLSIKGIGMETMESLLCYIFGRKVFVMDKYTFRIFGRIGLLSEEDRIEIRHRIEEVIKDNRKLGNFHAALVNLGKDHCRTVPECHGCPVSSMCNYYMGLTEGGSAHIR
ncbi:MAG: endonuclease III domain-containing protein [Candidatus Thermoplasmatota archaeon]|nr:endonuclease III domain-containing protein [Candidatus Thermoplasmatota archaeon]